jgi:tetratricopeptide (TPR) repeat protein
MDDFTILKEIEAYLDGEMTIDQKSVFEEKIQKQPELNGMVNLMKISREAIILAGHKKTISDTHDEYITLRKSLDEKKSPLKKSRVLSVFLRGLAAGFILIMLATSVLIYDTSQNFFDRKYLNYVIPVERSSEQNMENLTALYTAEKWTEIINLPISNPNDSKSLFFVGMANFNMKNYDKAIDQFGQIQNLSLKGQAISFVDEAEFYKVFALIKMKDYSEALTMIEKINTVQDHNYQGYFSKWDQFKLKLLDIF